MMNKKCIKSQLRYSFVNFMNGIISQLKQNGQHKSWQHYRATLNSFMRFRQNRDLSLRKINAVLIESYEAYLKQQNVCRNTSSFYMRILRAVYNRAVAQGLVIQQHPFRHVYTGIDKTRKRAVSFDVVKQINQLDLKHTPSRDMYGHENEMYIEGENLKDVRALKMKELKVSGGERREKTKCAKG